MTSLSLSLSRLKAKKLFAPTTGIKVKRGKEKGAKANGKIGKFKRRKTSKWGGKGSRAIDSLRNVNRMCSGREL